MISRNWLCKPNKKVQYVYTYVTTDLRIEYVLCASWLPERAAPSSYIDMITLLNIFFREKFVFIKS